MLRIFLSFFVVACLSVINAHATDTKAESDIEGYKKELIALNQDIGTYYFIGDYIQQNIEDIEHQKIGTVQDFLLNNRGEVEQLVGELNSLAMGDSTLHISYEDIDRNEGRFHVAFKAAEMEEQLATYLANIETAAGDETEPLVSARRLHGRHILLPTGESIGEVERVVTDKDTQKVIGVLIKGLQTRPEYERFALPYPNGLSIKNTGLSNDLELAEQYVDIILEFTAEGIPK